MYRTIDSCFWNDPKVRQLTPSAKLVFLYLITNPHSHVGGLYYLPAIMATAETGLSRREWDRVCDTLSGAGLARFDHETDVVWVVNMHGYQARGEKADRAAANHIGTLHNSALIKDFLSRYKRVRAFVKHRVSIGVPAQDHFGTQDQEQEQEQNTPLKAPLKGGDKNRSRFDPPSIEDVAAYCAERTNAIDPQTFVDYYTANGWKVGGRAGMRDWKAAVRNWEKNALRRGGEGSAKPASGPQVVTEAEAAEMNAKGYRVR